MKISQVRIVDLNIPQPQPRTRPRRPSWLHSVQRAMPLSKYPEFAQPAAWHPGADETPVWIQVVAEDGTWGLGMSGFGALTAQVVEQIFAPLLQGRDCLAIEFLNDLMWRSIQRLGAEGHAAIARSGVDLALWDLKGKLLDLPVYSLLGGPCRDALPLYVTSDDLDWAMELGFTRFKLSNPAHYDSGITGLNQLEDHVARARETVGPDAELMLNPIMAWNVEFAVQAAERLRPYRLRWMEEPLIPGDARGYVELRRAIPWMPLATGEDHHGRHAFLPLIETRAVDILQPDLCWCGGLSEAIKIYSIAETAGLQTIVHLGGSTPFGQHFSLAMPEAPMAEVWLGSDPGVPFHEINDIPGMALPENGSLVPSDAPGFGLEIPEDAIVPRRSLSANFKTPISNSMRHYPTRAETEIPWRWVTRDVLLCCLVMNLQWLVAPKQLYADVPSDPFVAKPYIQLGNAPRLLQREQMIVTWHTTHEEAEWNVEYLNGPESTWQPAKLPTWDVVAVETVSPHRVYRGRITDLIPGEEFFYRVKRNGKTVFSSRGRARRPRSQSHRCVVVADCGTGSVGQRNVAYQVSRVNPDYVLIPGDIVYESGRIVEYEKWVFPIYNSDEADPERGAPLLRSIPFFGGLGAHDTGHPLDRYPDGFAYYMYWSFPLNGPSRTANDPHAFPLGGTEARRKATLAATGNRYPVMANYSFDYGNAHWTVLDTWNPHIDWNDEALRTWLRNDLAGTTAKWKFVSSYLPPFNSSTEYPHTQKMRVVADILQQNNVDIVFCGFAHSYQVTYPLQFTAKPAPKGPVKDPGHVIPGEFELDDKFDGNKHTTPKGILYITTGGGGNPSLHSPEQTDNPETWQGFTVKYNASINQFTEMHVEEHRVTLRQIDQNGRLIDRILLTH
jgi:L-rhamnonate dehydratase